MDLGLWGYLTVLAGVIELVLVACVFVLRKTDGRSNTRSAGRKSGRPQSDAGQIAQARTDVAG